MSEKAVSQNREIFMVHPGSQPKGGEARGGGESRVNLKKATVHTQAKEALMSLPTASLKEERKTVRWLDNRTKEWECCGLVWQLMMSRLYPERYKWTPICPICGKEVKDDKGREVLD